MARKAKRGASRSGAGEEPRGQRPAGGYPVELRLRAVQEVLERGRSVGQTARLFGVSPSALKGWVERYQHAGLDGLMPQATGGASEAQRSASSTRREAVLGVKEQQPDAGTRRIRDVLARFEGLGVSERTVRRILQEEGLLEGVSASGARGPRPPRRFERARPNQLWQSDIFTFLLRRHERLYVTVFMDDHSRYVVSHAMAHQQKSVLVLEALDRGIAAYGAPEEVLTDNGRQYTAWRGQTAFEAELRRQGIRHIKSRPQHPQTLGKVERFWKTLWEEFLSKTVFSDFGDCQRRLGLFIDAYNFQRPHQGIDGLVPADRYFQAAPQVREAVQRTIDDNALRLSRQKPVQKPFYLVGKLGDRDLSIAAQGGDLRVQLGEEQAETIVLPKENADAPSPPNRVRRFERAAEESREEGRSAQDALTADAEAADWGRGRAGRAGETPMPDGAQRAQWAASGLGRDRGGEAVAPDVLSAGDTSDSGDAEGARNEPWVGGSPDGAATRRQHGAEEGAGEAADDQSAPRALAAGDPQSAQEWADDAGEQGPSAQGAYPALGEHWHERFEHLEDGEQGDHREPELGLEPDEDFHGRALSWERKLCGESALSDAGAYDEPEEEQLRAGTESDAGRAAAAARGAFGADGATIGQRRCADAGPEPQSLPEPAQSGADGDGRGAEPAQSRAPAWGLGAERDTASPAEAGAGQRRTEGGAEGAVGHHRVTDDDGAAADEQDAGYTSQPSTTESRAPDRSQGQLGGLRERPGHTPWEGE